MSDDDSEEEDDGQHEHVEEWKEQRKVRQKLRKKQKAEENRRRVKDLAIRNGASHVREWNDKKGTFYYRRMTREDRRKTLEELPLKMVSYHFKSAEPSQTMEPALLSSSVGAGRPGASDGRIGSLSGKKGHSKPSSPSVVADGGECPDDHRVLAFDAIYPQGMNAVEQPDWQEVIFTVDSGAMETVIGTDECPQLDIE